MKTGLKFKLLDLTSKKVIRDSNFDFAIERNEGVTTILIDRDDVRVLPFTGIKTADGDDVFDGDLIRAGVCVNERFEVVTDEVHYENGFWQLGNFDGPLSSHKILRVVGNRFETRWPESRPAV